jgi:D-alanine transaminase
MSRVAYVNGRFVPQRAAAIGVEDRGFQFADAIYEVWPVYAGEVLDAALHFQRLERSLAAIAMPMPMSAAALEVALRQTLRRNRVTRGSVYLQVSRGQAQRAHPFPSPTVPQTVVITAKSVDRRAVERTIANGVAVLTTPDLRWSRCDIKSVGLLANVLAKQAAKEAGAQEAWLIGPDGLVREGASSTAFLVDHNGDLVTPPLGPHILPGVTRQQVLTCARAMGLGIRLQRFSVAEAQSAAEAFVTSASMPAVGVVSIDGGQVGQGTPGPITKALHRAYWSQAVAPKRPG